MSDTIIGYVYDGAFYEKWGTPRQGLCTNATAVVRLTNFEIAEFLKPGEPAIVLFVFHLNTSRTSLIGGQHFAKLPSKIKMPKCPSGKQSVFATRTPHRPNPVGLTVTFIDYVDKAANTVGLRGSDLIVGTPIVGIYPYDRTYHSLSDARFPEWVVTPLTDTPIEVCVPDVLAARLESSELETVIDVLKQDVRSRRSRTEHQDGTFCHCVCGAKFYVVYRYRPKGLCVLDVAQVSSDAECALLFGSADLAHRVRSGITSGRAPEVLEILKSKPLNCSHKT